MRHRGITQEMIEATLAFPDSEPDETPLDSMRYQKTMPSGRVLRVWVLHPPLSDGVATVKSCGWSQHE